MKETMALTDELLVDLWLLRLLGSQVYILTCMHRTVDYNTYSEIMLSQSLSPGAHALEVSTKPWH